MKHNLKSVVQDIINSNHLLEDGLFNGYINTTGLALMLQPYIKEKLNDNDVSFDSIKMALFRAGKNMKLPSKKKLFSPKNLYIKKDINIANITWDINANRKKLRSLDKQDQYYLSKILGEIELSIIFDNHYKEEISGIFSWEDQMELKEDLVLIWVSVPEWTQETPWIIYNVSKQLMFHWINITQVVQTKREFAVVVEEKDMQDTIYVLSSI